MSASYALPDPTCAPMTSVQKRQIELALEVLREFPSHASIYDGAMDVFAHPMELTDKLPFCVSSEVKDEVMGDTTSAGVWDKGLAGLTVLGLADQLGPRNEMIVKHVGMAAFWPSPIEEPPFADTRVIARSVLASFGAEAKPWRDQALKAMNDKDSLGTSAAQVAGASGDPEAVRQVASLFRKALDQTPNGVAITFEKGERLIELSYALGVAGPTARDQAPILVAFLNRDVETPSYFGVLHLPPKAVCRVLQRIGGPEAETAVNGPRCRN